MGDERAVGASSGAAGEARTEVSFRGAFRVPRWVWALAAVAAALTLFATSRGPGLSPDSTNYLSAGINLAHGEGLRNLSGEPLTIFPPGLPLVVAAGIKVGANARWTVRVLNATAYAATVMLGFVVLSRHVRSQALVAASTVLIAVTVHLPAVELMAWTEPTFIVICLALVLVLEQATLARPVLPWLVAAAALSSIGFFFRYAASP